MRRIGVLCLLLSQLGVPPAEAATDVASYMVPDRSGVTIVPLLTVGDEPADNGFRLVGTPDGLGARRLPSGNVEVYMNHELTPPAGLVRSHGRDGAFVSAWTIDPTSGAVIAGRDLITSVAGGPTSFTAFCSANLAGPDRVYNPTSGRGFDGHLFVSGEEFGGGRLFGADVSTGVAYPLPAVGLLAFENFQLATTGTDLTFGLASPDSTPGFIRAYRGTKKSVGSPPDRAGLTGGTSHALTVAGLGSDFEFRGAVGSFSPRRFSFTEINAAISKDQQQTEAAGKGAFAFVRVEDGSWDPSNPNDFYFVTTARPLDPTQVSRDSRGGLWRLRFDDLDDPLTGGTITLLIGGDAAQPLRNPDNIEIDRYGHLLIQEDPAGRILAYRIIDGALVTLARVDTAAVPIVAESSGILDVSELGFGAGTFLFDVQMHDTVGLPGGTGPGTVDELVQRGQLSLMTVDWSEVFPPIGHQFLSIAGRLLDTRSGLAVGSGATISVPIIGRLGVPAAAAAVALNITGTEAAGAGFVTVFPGGSTRPQVSNLNLEGVGQTRANMVIVPIGPDGSVSVFSQAGSHLVVDLVGVFVPVVSARAGRVVPVTPRRVADTRGGAPLTGGSSVRDFAVDAPSGISAVVVNVTATEPTSPTWVAAFAASTPWPGTSTVNVGVGATAANLAIVPLGAGGKIALRSLTSVHVVLDVVGFVTDGSAADSSAGLFVPVTPRRIGDTRVAGAPRPGAGSATLFRATDISGRAVFGNVTLTETSAAGFVTAYARGAARPATSTVNSSMAGQTVANAMLVGVDGTGAFDLFTQSGTHLVVDLAGWLIS